MANENVMSAEDFAVVKLAAAERYRDLKVRPATADYLFGRKMRKEAAGCGGGSTNAPKVAKKAAKPAAKKAAAKPAAKKAAAKPDMDKITKLSAALAKTLPAKA